MIVLAASFALLEQSRKFGRPDDKEVVFCFVHQSIACGLYNPANHPFKDILIKFSNQVGHTVMLHHAPPNRS